MRTLLAVLVAWLLFDVIVGDAQQGRLNDRILGTDAASSVVTRDGDLYSLFLPGTQNVAPSYGGVIFAPRLEPTKNGAYWVYCSGTAIDYTCGWRVNVNGNVLEVGSSTWALN